MTKNFSLCVLVAAVSSMLLSDIAAAVPATIPDNVPLNRPLSGMPVETSLPNIILAQESGPRVAPGQSTRSRSSTTRRAERRADRRERRYDRRIHGDRCSYRRGNCRYYRSGYYYRSPWWLLPLAVPGIVIGNTSRRVFGNSHVRWCLNQYRSYNPRTNLWLSYSGQYRQCNSPYN